MLLGRISLNLHLLLVLQSPRVTINLSLPWRNLLQHPSLRHFGGGRLSKLGEAVGKIANREVCVPIRSGF